MVNADLLFAGIEGGATHSNIVLVNGNGQELGAVKGPSTNHWLVGMTECIKRIKKLVDDVKSVAGISPERTIDGLGLCLSGCEQESSNKELEDTIHKLYPGLAKTIFIGSDTIGSLSTACRNGGMILISGTGSNCLLLNPDGATFQSGGWGHMIGDEGGAYWIAARAVKLIFDEDDLLIEPSHPTTVLRKLVFEHFELNDSDLPRYGILPHCYSNFKKENYASLTAKVSKSATEGDQLCIELMKDAGYALGRYVSALSRKMNAKLFDQPNGLEIVCSGSVFKSWNLLKPGFMKGIQPHNPKDRMIPKFTLLQLMVTSAFGSIYKAALKYGYDLPRNYENNSKALFSYEVNEIYDVKKEASIKQSNSSLNGHSIKNTGDERNITNGFKESLTNGTT